MALQVVFLKHLGDVCTVLLDLVSVCSVSSCHSDRLDDDQIRSLCGALDVFRQKSHRIITIDGKIYVWKCKLIFPTDTLQQKIEITDLKLILAGENTSVLINLATTVVTWHFTDILTTELENVPGFHFRYLLTFSFKQSFQQGFVIYKSSGLLSMLVILILTQKFLLFADFCTDFVSL